MTKEQKDFILRLVFTFIEAAVAFVVMADVDFSNKTALKTLLAGALGAGVSAVINIARTRLKGGDGDEI